MAPTSGSNYAEAMAHLEAGCAEKGVASIQFKDGEVVMMTIEMLKSLVATAESNGQERILIFIATGPIHKEGAQA
jgi:hypothetical protein